MFAGLFIAVPLVQASLCHGRAYIPLVPGHPRLDCGAAARIARMRGGWSHIMTRTGLTVRSTPASLRTSLVAPMSIARSMQGDSPSDAR